MCITSGAFRRNELAKKLAKDFQLDLQSGTLDLYDILPIRIVHCVHIHANYRD